MWSRRESTIRFLSHYRRMAGLLYANQNPKTGRDLWVLPLTADRKPQVFVNTAFDDWNGQFSPDGRWVAYQSNQSGRDEIYVRPFPDVNAGRWQVSTGGGAKPLWARNGRELFYLVPSAGGSTLMRASIAPGAS